MSNTFANLLLAAAYGLVLVQAQISSEAQEAFDYVTSRGLASINDSSSGVGHATLEILRGNNNVQVSNYGGNSFKLENTGSKRIAAVFIDVTDSMFSDVVFDDDGSGGDSVAKRLNYDNGETDVDPVSIDDYEWLWLPARDTSFNPNSNFRPNDLDDVDNLFVDDVAETGPKAAGGFRGELLVFAAFDPDDSVGFSGDMDPNSIAGLGKGTVDSGANWDVGGVSGAEMVNGVVSILFGDGSTASGTIAADGSQAGSVAVVSDSLAGAPSLTVNRMTGGSSGIYTSTRPSISVSSSPGNTVRISMAKGFNPVVNSKTLANGQITVQTIVQARLDAQYPEFPVSNSKQWQHVEVTIPSSGSVDVSNSFDYDENLAVGFIAVIVDSNGLPVSLTTDPIRLRYSSQPRNSQYWTQFITGSSSETCNNDNTALVSGFACRGPYCDDVALKCFDNGVTYGTSESYWTYKFSEEDNSKKCGQDYFMTGVSCSGHYCDDLAIRCTRSQGRTAGPCQWSQSSVSEEGSGTVDFTSSGLYVKGIKCSGDYCDNKRFFLCSIVENN